MNTNHPSFAKIAFVVTALTLIAATLLIVHSAPQVVYTRAAGAAPDARTPVDTPTATPTDTPASGATSTRTPTATATNTPINTPTHTPTPTPTNTAIATPTDTATPTNTPTPTSTHTPVAAGPVFLPVVLWSEPPTVTPTPTLSPLPSVVNGNFEQGPGVGWTETVNGVAIPVIFPCSKPETPTVRAGCGGTYLAWLGGFDEVRLDILEQTITLPAGYSDVGVKFRYYTRSVQKNCGIDFGFVDFAGAQQTFNLCSNQATNQWRAGVLSVGAASGSISLRFTSRLNSGALSSFFIDDVQLCSDDPKAPAGTLPCTTQVQSSGVAPTAEEIP